MGKTQFSTNLIITKMTSGLIAYTML